MVVTSMQLKSSYVNDFSVMSASSGHLDLTRFSPAECVCVCAPFHDKTISNVITEVHLNCMNGITYLYVYNTCCDVHSGGSDFFLYCLMFFPLIFFTLEVQLPLSTM